jgi:peptidoglycan/xylan/chitin deacetylase (PgdA/CDA1 family)
MAPPTESVSAIPPRPIWRESPILKGMLASHAFFAFAVVLWPSHWLAWIFGLAIVHAVVIALVLQPRNHVFGANLTRLPEPARLRNEVAVTFDDGPEELVTPQVLDLLDRFDAKGSFFIVGNKLETSPDLVREIVRRGHSVENHSSSHAVLFPFFGISRLRRDIEAVQSGVTSVCGRAPEFFRPPAGFHSPLLAPLLSHLGLRLATWTRRGFDARDGDPERVLRRLMRDLSSGDILLLHDGNSARDAEGTPVVLKVLPRLLSEIKSRGLRVVSLQQAMRLPAAGPGERGL